MGEFLGILIIIFYTLSVLEYILGIIFKIFKVQISKNITILNMYKKLKMYVLRYHKIFGLLTIIFILSHFIIQFISYGLNITGMIAAITMILQVLLGLYGFMMKKKMIRNSINNVDNEKLKRQWKYWNITHKIIAVIILLSIIIHIAGD